MVRAAFEGDGAIFHQPQHVSGLHIMADGTKTSGNGSREQSSSDEAALSARLGSLDQRLSEIRDSRKIGTDQPGGISEDSAARASAMARTAVRSSASLWLIWSVTFIGCLELTTM